MKNLLLLLIFAFSHNSFANELKFCIEPEEYPPFFYSENSKKERENFRGLTIELVEAVAQDIGIKVKWIRLPWKRCISEVSKNRIDGVVNAIYLKEREKFFRFPLKEGQINREFRLFDIKYNVYTLKTSKVSWDGKQFKNLKYSIGTNLGYATASLLKKSGIPYYESPSTDKLFNLLINKKLDAIITLDGKGSSAIKKLNLNKRVIKLKIPYQNDPDFIVFAHKLDLKVSTKIWKEVQKFKDSKRFKLLCKKYNYNYSYN